jgi:serine/threonine-protein kinase
LPGERSPFIATKLAASEKHTIVVERTDYTSWSTTLKLPAGEIFTLPLVRLEPTAPTIPARPSEEPVPQQPVAVPSEPIAEHGSAEQPPEQPPTTAKPARLATHTKRVTASAPRVAPLPETKPSAPAKTAERVTEGAAPSATGLLRVNTRPWSKVSVDGVVVGNTPQMNIKVSAGQHTLKLENPEFGIKQELSVTIQPGQTVTRVLTLRP